ncbi:MAG: ribonuclease P protein component [Devosia sp.]
MNRLKKRSEFKSVATGQRVRSAFFTVQALARGDDEGALSAPRVGFTVTKRTGNAVERNRIKRRFRALSEANEAEFLPHTDYVIVARRAALAAPFNILERELAGTLSALATKVQRPVLEKRA